MNSNYFTLKSSFSLLLFIVLAFLPSGLLGAEGESQLARQIRDEIAALEQRIKEGETGQRNVIQQLQDIDKKIELRRRLISELEQNAANSNRKVHNLGIQIEKVNVELHNIGRNLSAAELNLQKLRNDAADRMVYFYKRISGVRLALLSKIQNINDIARRRKYFSVIEGFDRRSLEKITTQRNSIETDKKQREKLREKLSVDQDKRLKELERYRFLIQDKRQEESVQLTERSTKSNLLKKIESDNNLLRDLLEERRKALEEIEREILRQEQAVERKTSPVYQPDKPFSELAGNLNPPLKKLVVSQPFGPSRHPKLGTVTVNPGIDFQARPGEQVYAVANGQVTRVAWLRGFGNTVILSHGQGYYSVYSRLEEVYAGEGQIVKSGQTIGLVADAGNQSEFHLEIWSKRDKQDPLKWLRR